MKKLLIPIALLLLAVGCKHTTTTSDEVSANPYTFSDSVYIENDYEEGYSRYTMNIDLPVTDNDTLRQNIMHWMLDDWTEDYAAYVEADKNRFFEEEGNEPRAEFQGNYSLAEQTDLYVTYISEGYLYTGGPHPLPWYNGITFSKKDGDVMGYNLFVEPSQLIDIVTENIKMQWFAEIENEEDYADMSDMSETFNLPTNEPWVETDSIVFCYGPYEIAPYAAGKPLCKIAITDLKPFLSDRGKQLLKTE